LHDVWIVVRREFRERIRTRAFLLSTFLLPFFALAIFLAPALADRAGSAAHHSIIVVDETAGGLGERVVAALTDPPTAERAATFDAVRLARPLHHVRDSLTALVRAESLDGFLWIGPDFGETGRAVYRAGIVTNMMLLQRLNGAVTQAVQEERLDRAGLDAREVAALLVPAELETAQITRTGEGGDAASTMVFAYGVMFVLYMFIILYGTQVMQSVHEEKGNRIAEILMSSVRAPRLLAGKVFGLGAAALVQMAIWGSLLGLAALQRDRIAGALGFPVASLDVLRTQPSVAVLLLLFALLGFFLYAALFAAAGAATRDMQDAQQFVWILLMPLILPVMLQFHIVASPHGRLACLLGWFPFTAPLAMPLRMSATDIAPAQLAGSLLLLALAVAAVSWVAGKIYKVGMLSTGKRPSFRDLWLWIRAA
jgi:ABC-2 type transport system permease protein